MNELLQTAKAVIERWDNYSTIMDGRVIHDLRAAVDRAEAEPKNGLDQLIELIRFLEQQIEERNVLNATHG